MQQRRFAGRIGVLEFVGDNRMPASIEDVAKLANVSISTVSRVINRRALVNEETCKRVEAAIRELNYRPNAFARGLMLRKSGIVGLVLPDLHGEFYSEIIRGANIQARETGHNLLLSSAMPGDDAKSWLSVIGQHGLVDGLAIMVSDTMIAGIGSTLAELNVPVVVLDDEIHGVEHLLTRRAVSPEVGRALLERLAWWEDYTRGHQGQFNGVVGPGNQAGGLANIVEKSLGSAMKAGTTPLKAVYRYAEPVTESGFVFMDTPGYDPVATTGQIAGGANVICFTTGRGSMFGSKPAPTIKIASNTPMYQRLVEDMDVNAGRVIDGERTVPEMGEEIFRHILRVASGEATKSEQLGLGDHEFVPWHLGIVS